MNILVFGGTRFMGKHLVQALISQRHNVTIATRGRTKDNFGNEITRLTVDRTDAESLRQNIPNVRYDVVYDSLALCSEDITNLLRVIKCGRYIEISSAAVYPSLHENTKEEEFDAGKETLISCGRDAAYHVIKQQAECAISQTFSDIASVRVRFPFVVGADDYTKRLYFYVDHIIRQKPMFIDNLDAKMQFVRSDEAGRFLAFLADKSFTGAINAANEQTISMAETVDYIKRKTGKKPVLASGGEAAPYNGLEDYYLDVSKAKALGFSFTPLRNWIYELLDCYINEIELQKVKISK